MEDKLARVPAIMNFINSKLADVEIILNLRGRSMLKLSCESLDFNAHIITSIAFNVM